MSLTGCDTPVSQDNKSTSIQYAERSTQSFFDHADSTQAIVIQAIDSLRKRNRQHNFVRHFLRDRGYPVWSAVDIFPQNGQMVLLVPVIQSHGKKVSGIWNINMNQNQPVVHWVVRGSKLKGNEQNSKEALEAFMLGFEKQIFGSVQTSGLKVEIKTRIRDVATSDLGVPLVKTGWRSVRVKDQCYRIDSGPFSPADERDPYDDPAVDYYKGDWHCDYHYEWVYVDDGSGQGRGDDGRDGGGSGSGDGSGRDGDGAKGTNNFNGTIEVDNSIKYNELTNCVYDKLKKSNKFEDLVANFEGENTEFDLVFKLAETTDNALGELGGENPNDFIATIDVSRLPGRNGLSVAGTFIHEVMHAEMRRYSFANDDESSIPFFAGSFGQDWEQYVAAKFGKKPEDISLAEHKIMAERYVNYIAGLLNEYDNRGQIDDKYYRALAWEGLTETKAWKKAPQREIYDNLHDGTIEKRALQCNRQR